jgi:LysM repeat protein/ABC-type branched-subunit amino acid transport system substrate-binding protein
MKKIVTLFILILSLNTFSQDKVIVNGEEYLTHKVKRKETLYGISKQYNVTVDDINKANPEIINGLKKGQVIKVPVIKEEVAKTIDDRKKHIVQKGETLYSIAQKHGVTVDDLMKANPSSALGLIIGNELVIPKTSLIGVKTTHTVGKSETLYGIAQKYESTVEEIIKANPQKSKDLQPGVVLIIPKANILKATIPEKSASDKVYLGKIIEYEIQQGETLYGIAKKHNTSVEEITKLNKELVAIGIKPGDTLNIKVATPINLEVSKEIRSVDFTKINKVNPLKDKLENMVKKDSYNMTLLLPFMLDKNDAIEASRMPGEQKKIYPLTEMSTHFYQGVKLALDTVKATGISIKLNVFDTKKDTGSLNKLFLKEELLASDVIIGPLYEQTYSQVASFAKLNKIQMVCPVEQTNKSLFNNPYLTKLKVSLPTQAEYLGEYLAKHYNTENVIIVTGKSKKDIYLAEVFTKKYNHSIVGKANNYKANASEFKFVSYKDMSGMKSKLVGSKKNIIVFPTTDLGMAASFFTQLNVEMNKPGMHNHEVMIFGLENYIGKEFDNISIDHKVKYNLHVTSSEFIDYDSDAVKDFVLKYRAQYGTEPSDFAFMGYDAALYHAMGLQVFGPGFTANYDYIQIPLLQSKYNLKRTDENSGFENNKVFILSYSDYKLSKVE